MTPRIENPADYGSSFWILGVIKLLDCSKSGLQNQPIAETDRANKVVNTGSLFVYES